MRPRRDRVRRVAVVTVLGLVLGLGGGVTYAAFSSTTSNGASSFATDTDWTPPTGTSVIAKTTATTGGFISQGSAYYVYASVTDSGNPASGVASVRANVTNITTGQNNVVLTTTGGPWTIGGVSYNYRSASLTANNPLAAGVKTYTLTMIDSHSPANSSGAVSFNVTVDNTAPSGGNIQANTGNGTPDAGDTLTFTFDELMDASSILAGWDGTSTTVRAFFQNGGCGVNDSVTIQDSAGGTGVHLGTVCVGDVVNGNRTFTPSTMVLAGAAQSVVTVTLGGNPGGTKAASNTTLTWTPSALATDVAGNACSTAVVTESGALDTDF
jgi:predicted ribosomally synthesized peptide with SipW-like signal peptide